MAKKGKDVIEATAGRDWNYTPEMQFYWRFIERAEIDCMAAQRFACPYLEGGDKTSGALEIWDTAIMARDWIRRPVPDPKDDFIVYLISFDHCCEVLGIDADGKRLEMLARIDAAVDFDLDAVWARIAHLSDNPPDKDYVVLFDAPRVVPERDQGCLFSLMEAA